MGKSVQLSDSGDVLVSFTAFSHVRCQGSLGVGLGVGQCPDEVTESVSIRAGGQGERTFVSLVWERVIFFFFRLCVYGWL